MVFEFVLEVNVDCLDLGVAVEGLDAVFPSMTTVLVSSEWDVDFSVVVAVDVDGASLELSGNTMSTTDASEKI